MFKCILFLYLNIYTRDVNILHTNDCPSSPTYVGLDGRREVNGARIPRRLRRFQTHGPCLDSRFSRKSMHFIHSCGDYVNKIHYINIYFLIIFRFVSRNAWSRSRDANPSSWCAKFAIEGVARTRDYSSASASTGVGARNLQLKE